MLDSLFAQAPPLERLDLGWERVFAPALAEPKTKQMALTFDLREIGVKASAMGNFVVMKEREVTGLKKGRLYTQAQGYAGNSWYVRTGRSCWYPTGQSHLVEPTPAVRAFGNGELGLGRQFTRGTAELYGTDLDRPGSMFSPLFYRARGPRA